jgi:hypothetical protein
VASEAVMYSEDKFSNIGRYYEVSHGGKVPHFVIAVTACGVDALSEDAIIGRCGALFSIAPKHRE